MKLGIRSGQLIKWKDDRGFGFIQPVDGSQEIFLHISELKDTTRRPQVGDTIYYHVVAGQDGKVSACNAFILGARSKPTSSSSNNKATSNAASTSRFPLLEVLLLSILPLVGAIHFAWTTSNPLPLILYPVMSLLTFVLYADDKSRAKRGNWRTSEKTLHLCELAGGWLGGFVAQRRLRHKSSKGSYQAEFWAIVAIHYIVWLTWLFLGKSISTEKLKNNVAPALHLCRVQSQVAVRLLMKQFFEVISETIVSRITLKSDTVFAGVVYFQYGDEPLVFISIVSPADAGYQLVSLEDSLALHP